MGFQDDFARSLKQQRTGGDTHAPVGQGIEDTALPNLSPDDREVAATSSSDTRHPEPVSGSPDDMAASQNDETRPSPTPRHDGWTPDIRVRFLEALANCGNISSAAAFVQRSRRSAYNLKQRDIDFSRGWDAAVLISRDAATDCLQDRAMNGIEEDIYHQGEVVGTRRRYDSRLLLAHIGRLDRLAERITVSRGAARFDAMLNAIGGQEDTAMLIAEPTTDEIAEIIAEAEAEATVHQVESACLRQNNEAAALEAVAIQDADQRAAPDIDHSPMREIDWGDGGPLEYYRMSDAEAATWSADYPQVKTRKLDEHDPAFIAAITARNAHAVAEMAASKTGETNSA
ncbi:MAG: hypothetical protein ABJP02_08670 [Parasphingorhabdus sp.]|uniref:hypothetical protein n=1 Tax=Parasphingorhabdus sp. TaxID=2709688 RepID=UPI0032995BE8